MGALLEKLFAVPAWGVGGGIVIQVCFANLGVGGWMSLRFALPTFWGGGGVLSLRFALPTCRGGGGGVLSLRFALPTWGCVDVIEVCFANLLGGGGGGYCQ